jgi:hypothetical protein
MPNPKDKISSLRRTCEGWTLNTCSRIVGGKVNLQLELSTLIWTIVRPGYPACPSMDVVFLWVEQNVSDVFFLQVGNLLIDTLERSLDRVTSKQGPAAVSPYIRGGGEVIRPR